MKLHLNHLRARSGNNTNLKKVTIASLAVLSMFALTLQPSLTDSNGTAKAFSLDQLRDIGSNFFSRIPKSTNSNTSNTNTSTNSGTSFTAPSLSRATLTARVTGIDIQNTTRFGVGGTDLGMPFELENGSVGFIFGDTFSGRDPGSADWRSQVMLRSNVVPNKTTPIVFDSAAGLGGDGIAPQLISSEHNTSGNGEFSAIPTDGVSIPENVGTGKPIQVLSFQSVRNWNATATQNWATNYAGLAVSYDGNTYHRVNTSWQNTSSNSDPYQMISMQRDGDYIYIISVKAGRQQGPMMLRRVSVANILNKSSYECWNGSSWGGACRALFSGRFGEPSLRKLKDGVWAMAYLNIANGSIVTRYANSPTGPWSSEKTQVTIAQHPALYGGFIHPYSTSDNVTMMVSSWVKGTGSRYDVSQYNGSIK